MEEHNNIIRCLKYLNFTRYSRARSLTKELKANKAEYTLETRSNKPASW